MEQFDFKEYVYKHCSFGKRYILYRVASDIYNVTPPQDICLSEENAKIICEIYKLAEKLK